MQKPEDHRSLPALLPLPYLIISNQPPHPEQNKVYSDSFIPKCKTIFLFFNFQRSFTFNSG
ncbi:hypothetical protein BDE27_0855 [Xenorhabdus ehlersii]|uniref:Uncharacterized protein n=1 Tax=Xenorhabdus ehlersii TaxID=290111 RepID=A0A2D0IM32_9GAMM|nr:hypothetical protein Xehl_03366 [Xenorhabdus ehlersii]RKE93147.1 hypothetical protein BDE27_0855 [Xenorhabdus ehlersii]